MAVSLDLLTDEAIADYSRSDGKDRVLYDHGDLNLRYNDVHPIPGGVYDLDTFGSPIEDRCICGKSDNLVMNLVLTVVQEYFLGLKV